MLAFFVTRLTRMGVRLEPSRSSKPLINAAADIWRRQKQSQKPTSYRNWARH
jgi:hypothetical protein